MIQLVVGFAIGFILGFLLFGALLMASEEDDRK